MITKIDQDGYMSIKAETHLEAYALRKWSEDNIMGEFPILMDCNVDEEDKNDGR